MAGLGCSSTNETTLERKQVIQLDQSSTDGDAHAKKSTIKSDEEDDFDDDFSDDEFDDEEDDNKLPQPPIKGRPWKPPPPPPSAVLQKKVHWNPPILNTAEIWLGKMRAKMTTACNQNQRPPPRTGFSVSDAFWKTDPAAYQPRVVGIGPQQQRNDPRLIVTDDDKWRCVRFLLSRHSPLLSLDADRLLKLAVEKIRSKEAFARRRYATNITMDSYSFVEMLLLDAGFVLHVLLVSLRTMEIITDPKMEEEVDEKEEENDKVIDPLICELRQGESIKLDLLLLENQIPFFVIQDLFDLIKYPGISHVSLAELALELFDDLHPKKNAKFSPKFAGDDGKGVLHLLHLYHSALVPSPYYRMTDAECWNAHSYSSSSSIAEQLHVPSARKLQKLTVRFREKEDASSFLDVSFRNGVLEIPALRLFRYSNVVFRNLAAFEESRASSYVTDYLSFMECLVQSKQNLRLLQSVGAVENRMGADAVAAKFFNQVCCQVDRSRRSSYLAPLYRAIGEHCDRRRSRWSAGLKRNYLLGLVLLYSLALLSLICLQTIYTLIQYYDHK
ncbi:UPF0481 protein [Canna indica]|uniref:UPF0481 protein n=1 Tax=Canna indica TaxID=4628 RepID=A0AAQ3JUL7_9LILI|nr:UPF0481 protein [Canna indica]